MEQVLYQIEEPHERTVVTVGIDFGTTNSLVSWVDSGVARVLRDEHNKTKISSAIAVTESGALIVGTKALGLKRKAGIVLIKSIKRLIGKTKTDISEESYLKKFLDTSQNDVSFVIHKKRFNIDFLVSEVFRKLKALIDNSFSSSEIEAVVTVPAYFDELQRRVIKRAASGVGINVLRIINEPTAAALAYKLDKIKHGTYVVYDFGGGTFDVSILRIQDGIFRVIATGGDAQLGGDDIDCLIAKTLALKFGESPEEKVYEWLSYAMDVKEALSFQDKINIEHQGKKIVFTRKEFECLISDTISKTINILKQSIISSDVNISEIDGVILAGGSTRVALVEKELAEFFPNKRFFKSINPDEVVAIGAAMQAYNLKENTGDLLLDVTPLSLGIELMGGLNEKIIPRNSTIPISVSKEFTTYKSGQTGLKLHITQGESQLVRNCISLASVELLGIPPMKAGEPRIKVTFTMDSEGFLRVDAEERSTGASRSIEVVPTYGLTADKVKEIVLVDDYVQDMKEKELTESVMYAKEVSAQVSKAVREDGAILTNKEYDDINYNIEIVNDLVSREEQHKSLIDRAVNALEDSVTKFLTIKNTRSIKIE